jgi:hypothetical protein
VVADIAYRGQKIGLIYDLDLGGVDRANARDIRWWEWRRDEDLVLQLAHDFELPLT